MLSHTWNWCVGGKHHISCDDLFFPTIWLSCSPPPTVSSSSTNEFWLWLAWGPNLPLYGHLSSWLLPWRSKCLSWILNEAQDHLHASWSTVILLPRYCSAGGLVALTGWMGFQSAVLWVQAEILGAGGCLKSVWWCPTRLSNLCFQPF